MTDQKTHSYPPTDPPSASSTGDEPERVVSDPVPVPPSDQADPNRGESDQADSVADRTTDGDESDSPPAEDVTDRVPGEALDDRGTFDDPVLADERTDPDDITAVTPPSSTEDADATSSPSTTPSTSDSGSANDMTPEFHEPAPQPTAFGAATVGGAAAAAALAGPSREVTDSDRDDTAIDRDTAGVTDSDRDVTYADRDIVAADRDVTDSGRGATTVHRGEAPAEDEPVAAGTSIKERAAETPAEDEPVAAEFDVPAAAESDLLPGDVPAEPVTALWGDETAQSFRDRWREVQLRFVDDPQGAAQEAKTLVADAVDSLTAALSTQRDELSGWSSEEGNDTERFRVVVRQYRDFLDRLLGL